MESVSVVSDCDSRTTLSIYLIMLGPLETHVVVVVVVVIAHNIIYIFRDFSIGNITSQLITRWCSQRHFVSSLTYREIVPEKHKSMLVEICHKDITRLREANATGLW